ncbi:MAG: c-type cytochrome domain-containing protein [Verrucomicrobiales bacterium]
MNRTHLTPSLIMRTILVGAAALLTNCASVDNSAPPAAGSTATPLPLRDDTVFMTQIKPLLELRCLECHNDKDAKDYAGLSLQTRQSAMTSGRSGGVLRPGDPDGSLLLRVLSYGHEHPVAMPPSPDKLWDDKKKLIHDWIKDGAVWPEPPRGRLIRPQDVWE